MIPGPSQWASQDLVSRMKKEHAHMVSIELASCQPIERCMACRLGFVREVVLVAA